MATTKRSPKKRSGSTSAKGNRNTVININQKFIKMETEGKNGKKNGNGNGKKDSNGNGMKRKTKKTTRK